ncbi:hypothetical protein QBC43DRAFT_220411 [Cladorrhinum sp. PSN259]|nr:hypothetical protein QBC43DRAFT_220411 [Cladorrhinum sp. PSN259]
MLAIGATANPIGIETRSPEPAEAIDGSAGTTGIDKCATVRCGFDTKCVVLLGIARCVPVQGQVCGQTVCAQGLTCCNPSCSICTKPDMYCTQQVCNPAVLEPTPPIVDRGRVCGTKICPLGQECCNPSCEMCTVPGKGCTKQLCPPKEIKCGKGTCPTGQVCCNSSCGICTPPDGMCTQQYCAGSD